VKRGREEREESILQVLVDDAIVVKVVIEDRADDDDGDRIVLGKVALCEDVVNERLEVLVKLSLKGRRRRRGEHRERFIGIWSSGTFLLVMQVMCSSHTLYDHHSCINTKSTAFGPMIIFTFLYFKD